MRVQLLKKLRIDDAKKYVAEKLGVTLEQMTDVVYMSELRDELGIGYQEPYVTNSNVGMEAKIRLAEVMDLKINSVEKFKERAGLK